jgi:hypothetical protein
MIKKNVYRRRLSRSEETMPDSEKTQECMICGRPMQLMDEEEERWYCYTDDQVFLVKQNTWKPEVTQERLAEVKRIAEEKRARQLELGHVIIVPVEGEKEGKEWKYGKDYTLEDISNLNRGHQNVGQALSLVWWGPVGGSIIHSVTSSGKDISRDAIPDRIQKKIRKHITEDPYRYPYTPTTFHMLCPRCRSRVRVDQQFCEQCGTKVVIPVPRYISV